MSSPNGERLSGFLQPRVPPHNIQLEQALLGALLSNNKAYERVGEFLLAEHFAEDVHGRIYKAIQDRLRRGSVATALMLEDDFRHACVLDDVSYLTDLLTATVGFSNVGDYGRQIVDLWRRRQVINIAQISVDDAFDANTEVMTTVSNAVTLLDGVALGDDHHKPTLWVDAIEDAITAGQAAKDGTRTSNVTTGFSKIDEIVGDLEPGDVTTLGGRTGTGKSGVALQIADYNAGKGIPVCYFSTEMQSRQLGRRLIALSTGVSVKAQKTGQWSQAEDTKITQAWARAKTYRQFLSIEDCPGLNIPLISTKAKAFARKHLGVVGLVVIDHLHDLAEMHADQMTAAIGKIATGAKGIAQILGWHVLLLSQMNRGIEEREDKKPENRDLYGGTQIETNASTIMLLHRPDKYLNKAAPDRKAGEGDESYGKKYAAWEGEWNRLRGRLDFHITKTRDSDTGYVAARFDGPSNRTVEMEAGYD